MQLSVWKPLISFRPSAAVQQKIKTQGAEWLVHRIEKGASVVSLDYYSLKITALPKNAVGATMTAPEVFAAFKTHLLDATRPSAQRVSFSLATGSTTINAMGSLLKLGFLPFSFQACSTEAFCQDIPWIHDANICAAIDAVTSLAAAQNSVDDAYIVVGFSSPKELRVSTVQGGNPLTALFSFQNTGAHPVAGNRGFGWFTNGSDTVLYTIGADRLVGLAPPLNDFVGRIGYCIAEVFWRQVMAEFGAWISARGGIVAEGVRERRSETWADVVTQAIYDPAGQDAPDWIP